LTVAATSLTPTCAKHGFQQQAIIPQPYRQRSLNYWCRMIVCPKSPIARVAGVALALASLAFLPSKAFAECGDYVQILNRPKNEKLASHIPHPVPNPDEKSTPTPSPCRGPHCSNDPSTPQPLTAIKITLPTYEESIDHLADDFDEVIGVMWAFPISNVRPIHKSRSIFHPPRTPGPFPT
jgi:hypothetical protein